ncbi:glycosyltransferase [Phragmitibacter flavus]|uniref:glycosyltransferase n=1 Tax=Phragmitibacter flavus TaxID=2576071 RepID=UPI00140BDFA7|nr:glycosyltransferase [Phragmitibacter flavus]
MPLINQIRCLSDKIPSDFGGGSPMEKIRLMVHLATCANVSTYVEIGVYRGRSFLPMALAMKTSGGRAFGVDPYSRTAAAEDDVSDQLRPHIDHFVETTDFDQIYSDVEALIDDQDLRESTKLLRVPSSQAAGYFRDKRISIGMLHVDGNHDTRFVMEDVQLYLPLMEPCGLVILDDIDWDSIRPAHAWLNAHATLLFETSNFAVFFNGQGDDISAFPIKRRELNALFNLFKAEPFSATWTILGTIPPQPKVSISLITYNQERYVAKALDSILCQQVDFDYELVISDDHSHDGTPQILLDYQTRHPDRIRLNLRTENVGAVPNYLDNFSVCRGDYVAFLEGDDYWMDPLKLAKQVNFLEAHPDHAICCHNVMVVDANNDADRLLLKRVPASGSVIDLCRGDYISTPSCMVRNHLLDEIPDWLYTLPGCDWPLDILHAEKGKIGYLNDVMAAYRVHATGIWSGHDSKSQLETALSLTQAINRQLCYRYTRSFQIYEQQVRSALEKEAAAASTFSKDERGLNDAPGNGEQLSLAANGIHEVHREYLHAMGEIARLRDQNRRLRARLATAKEETLRLRSRLVKSRRTIASAELWQRRSWTKRAFHRWRTAPLKEPLGALQRLLRSLRKRRWLAAPPLIEPPKPAVVEISQIEPITASSRPSSNPQVLPHTEKNAFPHHPLVILDDAFPHPLSGFRFQEFHSYLEAIPGTMIHCTGEAFPTLGEQRSLEELVDLSTVTHPALRGRVQRLKEYEPLKASLAYLVFLGNIHRFQKILACSNLPFVFTLYPGGYFEVNNPQKDAFMRSVFKSPLFRHVIVTQNITHEYLLEKKFCRPDQITAIYGVVTPLEHLNRNLSLKKHYGPDKPTLDICFVAHRYSPNGADKGYDVFVEVAKRLSARHLNIQFHVVGNFDATIIDITGLENRITFHGTHVQQWFASFYADKDIILSPNLPFVLGPGYFDGFPTGCCTDAALHEVALFCTDTLQLNQVFTHGVDIVIIPYSPEQVVEIISHYHEHPDALKSLAQRGCEKVREVYSYEQQIAPRIQLLKRLIEIEIESETGSNDNATSHALASIN